MVNWLIGDLRRTDGGGGGGKDDRGRTTEDRRRKGTGPGEFQIANFRFQIPKARVSDSGRGGLTTKLHEGARRRLVNG